MFDMNTLAALGSSLSSATTLTKAILGMKVDQEVIVKVSALQSEIMSAQSAALSGLAERAALLHKVDELEKQLKVKMDWETQAGRYKLTEFATGAHAYVLREDDADGEPAHRLCPNCFQKNEKSILQTTRRYAGGEIVECPSCNMKLKLAEFVAQTQAARPRRNWMD